ncbi:hypothetical protein [Aeromicrobium sp. Root472D3]|uniref:hypothetical protein n=1 Tax=Aeromicrobium sp. Root472D3 TaxID=1736540 RepID=UPI0006F7375B|nr:hypothetical protein [Aeromicrobium sp. Root472D3]KQX75344.1 hypothetical protein ASD10_09255 [Aeromicrobium sp. Root472D3]
MRTPRRLLLAEDVTVSSRTTGLFTGPAMEVWDRIEAPETQVLMSPETVLAGRLPGTGRGVGEIQYYVREVDHRRDLVAIEILEYEHGRRAVTETITHPDVRLRTTTLLESAGDDRVRLTHEWSIILPAGTDAAHAEAMNAYVDACAEHTATTLRRVFD